MKITDQTLMVNVENTIKVGTNNELELTIIQQIVAYTAYDGEVKADVELVDVDNIKFLGKSQADTYTEFCEEMVRFGIDYQELVNNSIDILIPVSLIEAVKRRYKSILESNSLEIYAVEEEK